MCIICIDIERDRLRFKEAIRNLREMYQTIDYDHRDEVIKRVLKLEIEERRKKKEAKNEASS